MRGAEDADCGGAQTVAQAVDQWRLGADDDQVDAVFGAKRDDGGVIGDIERVALGVFGDAGIAWCRVELAQQGALRQFPGQRVFASAAAEQQDIHEQSLRTR